jgi:glutamine amidotransferase
MESLKRLDMVGPLQDIALSNKPLIAICLGMQLLMTESYEFGRHLGLGIIEGPVVRFDSPVEVSRSFQDKALKVPQVGWNRIFKRGDSGVLESQGKPSPDLWSGSLLQGLRNGEYMYFVHSFYAKPEDSSLVLSISRYGHIEFCSGLRYRNVFACQFHPERSGPQGLHIYSNIAAFARSEGLEAYYGLPRKV